MLVQTREEGGKTERHLTTDANNTRTPLESHAQQTILYRVYKDGEYVCKEGDTGEEMYVLEQGEVDVFVGEIKVGTMEVGAVFGELSLIYGTKRTAGCRCKGECIVYSLSKVRTR